MIESGELNADLSTSSAPTVSHDTGGKNQLDFYFWNQKIATPNSQLCCNIVKLMFLKMKNKVRAQRNPKDSML